MIRGYDISDCQLVEFNEPDLYRQPVMVFVNPDHGERKYLTDELNVDEITLHSALDPDEISRLELETDHVAMIIKRPKNYSTEEHFLFKTESIGIFLFREKIVFVVNEDIHLFDGRLFLKIASLTELALKIFYCSVFHFLEHLKVISMVSDELEQKVKSSMENKYLVNMFNLEKSLVYYLNAITENGALIEKLKQNSIRIGFNSDETDFLEYIKIENTQCFKQSEITSNILTSLMNARVSVASNNLNVLMKTLTLITVGIQLPTLVVSIFSMNVTVPFSSHPLAFWIIMGLSTLSLLLFLAIWRIRQI